MIDIALGSKVQRRAGGQIGRVVRLWTAPAHGKEVYCPNPKSYTDGYRWIPARRMARVAWPGGCIGSETGEHCSAVQVEDLIPAVLCPECGGPMRRHGRGATAKKNGHYWTCIRAEAEVYEDANGHLHRRAGARHERTRCWTQDELDALAG